MLIKVSDYIIKFLVKKKINHVFAVTGGAALHLIHSAYLSKKIKLIPTVHEQAAAMAADSYSRITKNCGAAFATSGPGATNLVTGVSGAYFDSVPVIYITGQVSTTRSNKGTGVRQIGFQETDSVSIFKSITKYVIKIKKSSEIVYELEKAYDISKSGRPGPVLIDIPDNIQREKINLSKVKKYQPKKNNKYLHESLKIKKLKEMIENASRPVIILGWGVHLSSAEKASIQLIKKLGFPVVTTWGAAHIIESKLPLSIGTWGTHGTRYANFTVQNADLIISLGSRLDTKATGSPIKTFARGAKKIVVDVDQFELDKFKKFGLKIDLKIRSDAKKLIQELLKLKIKTKKKQINIWINQINLWKRKYPIITKKNLTEKKINPYVFINELSNQCKNDEVIFADTGCAIAWIMQAFKFKKNQLLFHDFNNTAMGWALPAAIAGSLAKNKKKRIVAIIGDGSFQLNIQELATLMKLNLPIKIFLVNNFGHAMIRQTQDQWLKSKYFASSFEKGLPKVNFQKVVESYGLNTISCRYNSELKKTIKKVINSKGAYFCNIEIDKKHGVIPQVKFGRPNEDPEPLLPRKEFLDNMIVDIIK